MTSFAASDSESNVSGFMRYNDRGFRVLYKSMVKNMEKINQDMLEVEKNLKDMVKLAGPLESQLSALLQFLPKQNLSVLMEVDVEI